jgi:hypothetical protein
VAVEDARCVGGNSAALSVGKDTTLAKAKSRFQFVMRGTIPGDRSWFLYDRQEVAEIGSFPNRGEAARYAADPDNYKEPEGE